MDNVKALEWVNKNIANFGGDPENVTILGQSGGGGKVMTLMGIPSAQGLFQRVWRSLVRRQRVATLRNPSRMV